MQIVSLTPLYYLFCKYYTCLRFLETASPASSSASLTMLVTSSSALSLWLWGHGCWETNEVGESLEVQLLVLELRKQGLLGTYIGCGSRLNQLCSWCMKMCMCLPIFFRSEIPYDPKYSHIPPLQAMQITFFFSLCLDLSKLQGKVVTHAHDLVWCSFLMVECVTILGTNWT